MRFSAALESKFLQNYTFIKHLSELILSTGGQEKTIVWKSLSEN